MSKTLIAAIAFSVCYFAELLVFESEPSKKVAGEGFPYCFLAGSSGSLIGLLPIRKRESDTERQFLSRALALSLWVKPAWRIELAVEEHQDREITASFGALKFLT